MDKLTQKAHAARKIRLENEAADAAHQASYTKRTIEQQRRLIDKLQSGRRVELSKDFSAHLDRSAADEIARKVVDTLDEKIPFSCIRDLAYEFWKMHEFSGMLSCRTAKYLAEDIYVGEPGVLVTWEIPATRIAVMNNADLLKFQGAVK